jgi:ribonuclease P protein component
VGNAVVRNRIKRGIREWFRRRRDSFPAPWDLVVIARRGSSRLIETGAVGTALDRTLNRARTQWTQR